MITMLGTRYQSAGGGCQGAVCHDPLQAPRILPNLMNCPKSAFRAASIMPRIDD